MFNFNPNTREYTSSDAASVIKRGATIYAVIRFRFVWFSSDSCGLSYAASTLAVIPAQTRGFDFIMDPSTTDSNATNRLWTLMCPEDELDLSLIHI